TDGPQVITPNDVAGQNGVNGPAVGLSHLLASAGVGLFSPPGNGGMAADVAAADLNASVLNYAVAALGTSVGDGGCWALVDAALKAAGADTSHNADCVFGSPVGLNEIIPGDLLQFEGVRFEGANPATGGWYWQEFPHHSAIVYAVDGSRITLLNQNINGDT